MQSAPDHSDRPADDGAITFDTRLAYIAVAFVLVTIGVPTLAALLR